MSSGNGTLVGHGILSKLSWALRSEPGDVRPHNEDFAGVYAPTTPDDAWDRGPFFVVCDGLGGHEAGEVASRLAVETAVAAWSNGAPPAPHQAVRSVARVANLAVYDAALAHDQRGMATTLVALTLAGREAIIAHVGDSRAYLVRDGQCQQLTADHSRVGEMLRLGLLTPEQAATHPGRSMLSRTIGGDPIVQIDLSRHALRVADTFVLCSDGLWDSVARAEIAEMCDAIGSAEMPTVVTATDRMVELALERGAPDNVTACTVRVNSEQPIPSAAQRRSLFRRGRG